MNPEEEAGWASVRAVGVGEAVLATTVRSDGRPRAVPLDGVWLDGVWYYGGSDKAVHAECGYANDAGSYAEVLG